jgi:hypothetical protein
MHILLWGLLRGRRCWGTWSISRFSHPFKVSYLREMVSIMAILIAKGKREVFPKIVVIISLVFVIISPLGVLFPLILVAPGRLVMLGVIPSWSWIIYCFDFSLSFWNYSTNGSDFPYSVVQNFDIVEWERDEQN